MDKVLAATAPRDIPVIAAATSAEFYNINTANFVGFNEQISLVLDEVTFRGATGDHHSSTGSEYLRVTRPRER